MPDAPHDLAAFLVEAKHRTYAGLDDNATVAAPLLNGSKQLEHRAGRYAYRDIYFGMGFFVGQETVSRDQSIIWSMSYSGGVWPEVKEREVFLLVYKFLRQALLAGDERMPYRGPAAFSVGDMTYRNNVQGSLERFHGTEVITRGDSIIFELCYSGGLLW